MVGAHRSEVGEIGAAGGLVGAGGVPRLGVVEVAAAGRGGTAGGGAGGVDREGRVAEPVGRDSRPAADTDHLAGVVEHDGAQVRAALVDQLAGGGGGDRDTPARQGGEQLCGELVTVEEGGQLGAEHQLRAPSTIAQLTAPSSPWSRPPVPSSRGCIARYS